MRRIIVAVLVALAPLACAAQGPGPLDLFNRMRAGDGAALTTLRAAAESGDAESQFQLGRAYSHGSSVLPRNDATAAAWVEKAALQGHAEAQSNLGYLYSVGLGVPPDTAKAMSWWTKSAEAGFVQAQFNLALAYLNGKLTEKNEAKAFEWMRRAAMQGGAPAQLNLGMMYLRGTGTEKNLAEAAAWYRKAAEQGNNIAMFNLGLMYALGDGVERDPAQGLRWLRRAEVAGNPKAAEVRRDLCRANAKVCEAEPAATHFEFEMTDPNIKIVIPDAPPMQMGPHPLGQPHTRFMGGGPSGFTISVLTPTADRGMTPADCARSHTGSLARRFGLKREDVVTRRTNDSTFVVLFPLKVEQLVQLKAFLLSGDGATHCIEVHLSKTLVPGAAVEQETAAWMKGFERARIESH